MLYEVITGIGVDGKSGVFGSTTGLVDQFGRKRVFDTPIAEEAEPAATVLLVLIGHGFV